LRQTYDKLLTTGSLPVSPTIDTNTKYVLSTAGTYGFEAIPPHYYGELNDVTSCASY
jgi:hypothetical protein